MSLERTIEERLGRCLHLLGLPQEAALVLGTLAMVDLERESAEEARQADEHDRAGVVSWRNLAAGPGAVEAGLEAIEQAVAALSSWGLVQVVGEGEQDPLVNGSAALRLTFAGRSCIGLAPRELVAAVTEPADEPAPWELWHAHSREGLLVEAAQTLGDAAWHPLVLGETPPSAAWLAGQVALRICLRGAVVVDAFSTPEARLAPAVEGLLRRTRLARGRRVLVAPTPLPLRVAAQSAGARMRWVQLTMRGDRELGRYDPRLNELLASKAQTEGYAHTEAHVVGVPDSFLATTERPQVQWEDLLVPVNVRYQLEQAMVHARFRLVELPHRTDLPGRATGYRLLLSGLPGTGKSMAAEALASALERPLVRLDLSSVLSKWLGETERFLAQIFEMAQVSGSVLVLDEAESLFRQRSDGGGGTDAMGTVVSYLLARLDRFDGVLVGTTNRTLDLDDAFFRRFDDFIVLPIPDAPTRAFLWRRMLGKENDPDIDRVLNFELLGSRFPISGGLIRGAALRAIAWAGSMERGLDMPLLLASLARELEKNDQNTAEVYVEPYRDEVEVLLRPASSEPEPEPW